MPKHFKVVQRSRPWWKVKGEKATASDFHRIVTPTGQLSKQSRDYAYWLLTQMMLGRPIETEETKYMTRGTLLEDQAIADFELIEDVGTEPGGFITNDAETIGVSPDRLIGDNGILEIKCPAPWTHMASLVEQKTEGHKPQVQGQLWIAEREYVSILSYHPELPSIVTKCGRDDKYIVLLSRAVEEFVADLHEKRRELEARYGPFPEFMAERAADGSDFISQEDGEAIIADFRQRGIFQEP